MKIYTNLDAPELMPASLNETITTIDFNYFMYLSSDSTAQWAITDPAQIQGDTDNK
jgi:hypothetical protein